VWIEFNRAIDLLSIKILKSTIKTAVVTVFIKEIDHICLHFVTVVDPKNETVV
jgi:hypothetical protein